jgi:hypothetical protein
MTRKLTPKQQQLYDAVLAGARIQTAGWQQLRVSYGERIDGYDARKPDPRDYVAMEATLHALRDRGLVNLGPNGITIP